MKLRIHFNSLRLRLGPSEVHQLAETGQVEESISFGAGKSNRLIYTVTASDNDTKLSVTFQSNRIAVIVPRTMVRAWSGSDQVGIEAVQPLPGGDTLMLLIEKDFACLEPTRQESDVYPNPQAGRPLQPPL